MVVAINFSVLAMDEDMSGSVIRDRYDRSVKEEMIWGEAFHDRIDIAF
jgi:hypothetical protein